MLKSIVNRLLIDGIPFHKHHQALALLDHGEQILGIEALLPSGIGL
jgi:hypothetical protein